MRVWPGTRVGAGGPVVTWETDEPSERGVGGMDRMRLVRDDIAERVTALVAELTDHGDVVSTGIDSVPAE